MIRLELTNVKNVDHNSINFHTLASGGSITGIYGANGSGKTTVIGALNLLKYTMSGHSLNEAHPGSYRHRYNDLVTVGKPNMNITALFRVQRDTCIRYMQYSATYAPSPEGVHIIRESVHLGNKANQLGRSIIARTVDDEPLALHPLYL